jgi:hypothetical protein
LTIGFIAAVGKSSLKHWTALSSLKGAKLVQEHPQKKEKQKRHQGHADFRQHLPKDLHLLTCTSCEIEPLKRNR